MGLICVSARVSDPNTHPRPRLARSKTRDRHCITYGMGYGDRSTWCMGWLRWPLSKSTLGSATSTILLYDSATFSSETGESSQHAASVGARRKEAPQRLNLCVLVPASVVVEVVAASSDDEHGGTRCFRCHCVDHNIPSNVFSSSIPHNQIIGDGGSSVEKKT